MKPTDTQRTFVSKGFEKAQRNGVRKANARKKLSDCELETGMSADELRAIQLEQKAQLLAKRAA